MSVNVTKMIRTHTNGKIKAADSPTGWKRRAGVERDPVTRRTRAVWEPCEGPQTFVYGSPEHRAHAAATGGAGGTITYRYDGMDGLLAGVRLLPLEQRMILQHYVNEYTDGLSIAEGNWIQFRSEMTAVDAVHMADAARARVLQLFGLDLAETNVSAHFS